MSHKLTTTLGALAAGFGLAPLAPLALAQQQPPAAADTQQLPAVRAKATAEPTGKDGVQATTTRIGKGEQDLRDVPQSVTVVTERLIDDRNLDTVKDALKNTAGVTFLAAEGGEEDIRLRGFALQSTGDVFVDGMRDPAFYERDTFFLDRLELLRGSASMLFGRGSTGGAVNQVTKQPFLMNQHQVDVTLGSKAYVRGVADLNVRLGESSALRIGAMATKADNNGAGSAIDKDGVTGTLRWGIGERHEFSLNLYHLENRNGMNYGLPYIRPTATSAAGETVLLPLSPTAYYGMKSDVNFGQADTQTLSHVYRVGGDVSVTTRLRHGYFDRDQRASTVRFAGATLQPGGQAASLATFGPNTVLTRGTQLKMQDVDTLALQSDLSLRFKAFGMNHEMQAGVDLSKDRKRVYSDAPGLTGATLTAFRAELGLTKPNTTVGTPDDGAWIDETRRQKLLANHYTAEGQGVYVQDLVEFLPHWKLLAGLRYDHLTGDYTTLAYTYTGTSGTHGYDKFAASGSSSYSMKVSEWSKRLGLLYQPTERMSFHLSGATSFNTSGDAYSLNAGNADVPPEQSVNVEAGAKIDSADGNFTTRFAVFRSTKLHERNTDPLVTNLVTLSGKRHAAGLELDLTGRLTPKWEVFGSYMWIPVAVIDEGVPGSEGEGTRPSLTPVHSGTFWTNYQVTDRLRLGAGLNARSGQTPNRNPGWYVPRFVTGDLMAEYVLVPEQVTVKANLSNVADKLYGDQLYSGHYIPGPGRTFQVTGSFKF
jgi:catecholate siderophore receptor